MMQSIVGLQLSCSSILSLFTFLPSDTLERMVSHNGLLLLVTLSMKILRNSRIGLTPTLFSFWSSLHHHTHPTLLLHYHWSLALLKVTSSRNSSPLYPLLPTPSYPTLLPRQMTLMVSPGLRRLYFMIRSCLLSDNSLRLLTDHPIYLTSSTSCLFVRQWTTSS